MSISLKTHKMLWGRSGSRCAFTDCRKELVMDATETDDESLIGEESHIIAKSADGPRGNSTFSEEQLNKYDNLILLCSIHHKIIDDQFNTYPIDYLKDLKAKHEKWVKETLSGYNSQKQRDDETYATYIEEWMRLAHIADWESWTSYLLGFEHPQIYKDINEDLSTLNEWIFSRIWPKRYPELEDSFGNFRQVLQDFQITFHKHSEKNNDLFHTKQFYHFDEIDDEKYKRLHKQYSFHVYLVQDLILELTRSANYICDKVRQFIDPTFRLKEGRLIISSGPHSDLRWHKHDVEYRDKERINIPYISLQKFKADRKNRDACFGAGIDINDPEFIKWYES